MTKLAHIFLDVDMRLGHTGLKEFLKKKRVKMNDGDFIVFLNSSRTIIKCFCNSLDAILHVKNSDKRIDLGVIKYLPKYCNGAALDLDAAVADNIRNIMAKRKIKQEN